MAYEILQQYWNDRATIRSMAAATGRVTLAERLAWQDVLRRHFAAGRKQLRILDVGTGTGYLPIVSADLRHKFTGLDWSQGLLTVAQQRVAEADLKVDFIQSAATSIEFPNAAFDIVIALNTLSVLEKPRLAVDEWQRVLKPGGKLLIVEDDRDSADFALYAQWLRQQSASSLDAAYQQSAETLPLWQAQSAEIEAFLSFAGCGEITSHQLAGQLERRGMHRRQTFAVGYWLFSAEKGGSIAI